MLKLYDSYGQPVAQRLVSLIPQLVIAESALDRLVSCSHVITLTGKSYRALLRPDKALEKEVVTM